MPEGPTIVLLKEQAMQFKGEITLGISGNSKIDQTRLINQTVIDFKSWGKHILICFKEFTLRIHLLMFGSYTINEKKADKPIRLNFTFNNGEINFYSCSIKFLEGDVNQYYDWSSDVMNEKWSSKKANEKLKQLPDAMVCDALLEQNIFAGVGNIIKNEVLYLIKVHPESHVGKLPKLKLVELIKEAKDYSFKFLEWKRRYVLKKHLHAHTKKVCSNCHNLIIRKQTGYKNRRSFICNHCQILY